jgi:hypothetical protein
MPLEYHDGWGCRQCVFHSEVTPDKAAEALLQCTFDDRPNECRLKLGEHEVSGHLFDLVDPSRRDAVLKHLISIGFLNPRAERTKEEYGWFAGVNSLAAQKMILQLGLVPLANVVQIFKLYYGAEKDGCPHCREVLSLLGKNENSSSRTDDGTPLCEAIMHHGGSGDPATKAIVRILNLTPGQMRLVDVPYNERDVRYYWALGNVKRALLALFCALNLRGIFACRNTRQMIGALLIEPVLRGKNCPWRLSHHWTSGKWIRERETWREDHNLVIAKIVAQLQTFDFKTLTKMASVVQSAHADL